MSRAQTRTVKVGFVIVSGVATGLVVLGPSACGDAAEVSPTVDATRPAPDADAADGEQPSIGSSGWSEPPPRRDASPFDGCATYEITLPEPGTQADPGTLCTLAAESAVSNAAAEVTLEPPVNGRAEGFVRIPPEVLPLVVGEPQLTIAGSFGGTAQITGWQRQADGFSFVAQVHDYDGEHTITAVLTLDCADAGVDGGVKTVLSRTVLGLCEGGPERGNLIWKESGEDCTVCRIIAEMAPSPVVSDNRGDDLPLGRVVQLRVVELARAGNQVLLFAESDAGSDQLEHAWKVSCGTLEHLESDLVLWTLPPGASRPGPNDETPFGQLGVWNEHGAAVENFLWSVAA